MTQQPLKDRIDQILFPKCGAHTAPLRNQILKALKEYSPDYRMVLVPKKWEFPHIDFSRLTSDIPIIEEIESQILEVNNGNL